MIPPAALALPAAAMRQWLPAALLATAALLLLGFFRVPRRRCPAGSETLVAPANGRIMGIDRIRDPEVGPGSLHRVATFLSVFDVHVQRAPTAGEVTASSYRPGRKLAAFRARSAAVNESHLTVIRREDGETVGVRQIAGLLARRIVCYLRPGQTIDAGQPLGLIKFGSRVDLLIPESFDLAVRTGQRLREGETPVAHRRSSS